MPTFNLITNVSIDGVKSSDLLKQLSQAVASVLKVPESYVLITINGDKPVSFGGTEEPAAYGELITIGGKLNGEVNKALSKSIQDICYQILGINSARFYIKFHDVERNFFGWKGATF